MAIDAIVTDAHARGAVAGIRALAWGGRSVLALGPGRLAAGLWSRFAAARAVGPDSCEPDAFARCAAGLAGAHGDAIVYPGQEEAIDALLAHPELVSSHRLPYPGAVPVLLVRDKTLLPALAREAGLIVPETLVEATAAELLESAPKPPYVVKPAMSGGPLASATLVGTREELEALIGELEPDTRLFLQERVGGQLVGLGLVVGREGQVVARFQQEAERTWPLEAGVSARAKSIAPDEGLVAACCRMLAAAGYWGLAHLQFLRTSKGLVLIDVNPRFYGSLPLALAAGVNLPAAWHGVATGCDGFRPGPYRTGVSYRWLEGDLLALARGRRVEALRPQPRPRAGAVWRADDPVPAVMLAAGAVGERVADRVRDARGRSG
jgi:predicted ATP-grasp superfamily ATP-dependent carboligase